MKKESPVSVALCGLCAALSMVNGVLEILDQDRKKSVLSAVATILTPALWTATFVLKLVSLRSEKEE